MLSLGAPFLASQKRNNNASQPADKSDDRRNSVNRMTTGPQKTVTRRGGLCGSSGGAHVPGSPVNHSGKMFNNQREDSKLRRGSMSRTEFIASAVLLSGTKASKRALARANCFDVIGGVSQSEIDVSSTRSHAREPDPSLRSRTTSSIRTNARLLPLPSWMHPLQLLEPVAPGDRAFLVQTWIVRLMTNRLAAGGLAIPPPLLSRTYQVFSDGTAAAMQARKVSYVAFPFPLRQLLVLLLWVFITIVRRFASIPQPSHLAQCLASYPSC